jgi:hypothetical protein
VGLKLNDPWDRRFETRLGHSFSYIIVVCYVVSGVCDELITRSVDSYSAFVCLNVGDIETSIMRLLRTEYFISVEP